MITYSTRTFTLIEEHGFGTRIAPSPFHIPSSRQPSVPTSAHHPQILHRHHPCLHLLIAHRTTHTLRPPLMRTSGLHHQTATTPRKAPQPTPDPRQPGSAPPSHKAAPSSYTTPTLHHHATIHKALTTPTKRRHQTNWSRTPSSTYTTHKYGKGLASRYQNVDTSRQLQTRP
jgi:hypothetical protein